MEQITPTLRLLAQNLSLESFVFIGTILEELVSPIPAPLILGTAGSLAHAQGYHFSYVFLLTIVATLAKTLVSWLFYLFSDKTEDFIFRRFGKFLAVKHEDVEKIGSYFNGTWKDDAFIILARAIPIVPTTTVSLVAGFIKLEQKSFIRSTFIGYFIRCFIFIYLGFTGASSVESFNSGHLNYVSTIVGTIVLLVVLALYLFNPFNRKKK